MYQTDPPRPPSEVLPTMYDLPSEDPLDQDTPEQNHPRPLWETMPTIDLSINKAQNS